MQVFPQQQSRWRMLGGRAQASASQPVAARAGSAAAPMRRCGFWTLPEAAAHLGCTPADVRRRAMAQGIRLLSLGCFPNGGDRIRIRDAAALGGMYTA
jgi:hypothetical protein